VLGGAVSEVPKKKRERNGEERVQEKRKVKRENKRGRVVVTANRVLRGDTSQVKGEKKTSRPEG